LKPHHSFVNVLYISNRRFHKPTTLLKFTRRAASPAPSAHSSTDTETNIIRQHNRKSDGGSGYSDREYRSACRTDTFPSDLSGRQETVTGAATSSGPTCRLTKWCYLQISQQYLLNANLRLLLILTFQYFRKQRLNIHLAISPSH
jgi:hypothetical protein